MRLYGLLLRLLYPASFRAEYAGEMQAIVAARLRKADGPGERPARRYGAAFAQPSGLWTRLTDAG